MLRMMINNTISYPYPSRANKHTCGYTIELQLTQRQSLAVPLSHVWGVDEHDDMLSMS